MNMKTFSIIIFVFVASVFSQTNHENKQKDKILLERQSSVLNLEFNKMALSKSGVLYLGGRVVATTDKKGNTVAPSAVLLATVQDRKYSIQRLPDIGEVKNIYLTDGEIAVISGIYKNLRTSDGGKTWEQFPNPPGIFSDLFFLNRKTAWFKGDDPAQEEGHSSIFKWNDGSTVSIATVEGFPYYRKFYFATCDIGWTIRVDDENVRFLNSKDGGRTWTDRTNPQDETIDFQFFDSNRGYILRESGLYSTRNGGTELLPVTMPKSNAAFRQMFFLDRDFGWLIGTEICSTKNGGHTWDCSPNDDYEYNRRYYFIAFQGSKNGWKLTKEGLFSTIDGGRNWSHFPITVDAYTF